MGGLPSILSLFCNKFNKFINTGARMLDSLYHMILKILKKSHFWRDESRFPAFFRNVKVDVIM